MIYWLKTKTGNALLRMMRTRVTDTVYCSFICALPNLSDDYTCWHLEKFWVWLLLILMHTFICNFWQLLSGYNFIMIYRFQNKNIILHSWNAQLFLDKGGSKTTDNLQNSYPKKTNIVNHFWTSFIKRVCCILLIISQIYVL